MGLESGWNCHISLKSNDGMTSMRKTVSYHCPSRPGYLPGRKKSGKRAAVAARNIKLIGMYIIVKKRVGTKKKSVRFSKSGCYIGQTKEGSRMERTLDFDSDNLGEAFTPNNVTQTHSIFVKI
jgi:hypothetical protein